MKQKQQQLPTSLSPPPSPPQPSPLPLHATNTPHTPKPRLLLLSSGTQLVQESPQDSLGRPPTDPPPRRRPRLFSAASVSNCFAAIPWLGEKQHHPEKISLADSTRIARAADGEAGPPPDCGTSNSSPAGEKPGAPDCLQAEEDPVAAGEFPDASQEEGVPPKTSFWSSLVTSTFAALETKADSLGRSLGGSRKSKCGGRNRWNVAVRRAVASASMRRLQERLLGSRWTTSTTSRNPIWLLGVCYRFGEDSSPAEDSPADDSASTCTYSEFIQDFSSRIWFSYRKGFEPIGDAKLTSDVGWGCMIRSGQMLLAQALICHRLGRAWRRLPSKPITREYLEILQCFGDLSSEGCPFSIHNILAAGSPYGLVPGSWLGPYALCRSLETLARTNKEHSQNEGQKSALPMAVYVVSGDADGERGGAPCICIDDVVSLCSNWEDQPGGWAPLLLLVPLVLGPYKVNPRYLPPLWATFSFPQSLGVAGGKPGASTYLIGVQDDQALYLDPHEVQQALTISPGDLEVDTSSYHCSVVRQMPLSSIDPSLALGFYCQNRGAFDDLCQRASELERESNGAPMFTVTQTSKRMGQRETFFSTHSEVTEAQDCAYLDSGCTEDQVSSEEGWQIL